MRPMRQKAFWAVTALFAAGMFFGGFVDIFSQAAVDGLAMLGYPAYFGVIIGVAKILGAVALVVRRFPILTEWAYAGFAFDLIGAAWSHAAVEGFAAAAMVLPFLVLLAASYRLSPRRLCDCACCQGGACKDCHR